MSHFTQLNLQGNSKPNSARPAPTGNPPNRKLPNGQKQLGSAKVAAIAGSLAVITVVVILTLAMRTGPKQESKIVAPTPAPVSAPAPVAAAQPALAPQKVARKSPRQHKLATYKNSDYGLSFRYPKHYTLKEDEEAQLEWTGLGPVEMNFVQPGGTTLTSVELPGKSYPGTDFTSAFLTVNVDPKMTSDECEHFAFPEDPSSDDAGASSKVKIGATDFVEMDDSTGGTSSQADARYFHVFENNVCYEFTLGVQTSTDDAKTKPVNRDAVFDKLKWMLSTVKIKPVDVPETPAVAVGTASLTGSGPAIMEKPNQ